MTHTIINIVCKNCNTNLNGVLYDSLNEEKHYSITCSKCDNQNIFSDKTGVVNAEIPSDAIEVMYVAKITNT